MSKKALIFGYGQMGRMIADVLHSQFDMQISVADKDIVNRPFATSYRGEFMATETVDDILRLDKPDVVVSSLPYFVNTSIAAGCRHSETPYIDLGGSVPVSKDINSQPHTAPVMTDMGLAPGLVNMWAEELLNKNLGNGGPKSVKMMVGGLPADMHEAEYIPTWSIDGLINEYVDSCKTLENGQIVTRNGMSGLEMLDSDHEMFYTSGGAAHSLESFKRRGILNASYKTIRYQGHNQIIRELSRVSRKVLRAYLDGLKEKHKDSPRAREDKVIIRCEVSNGLNTISREKTIRHTADWTAMQMATGIPVAVTAHLFATKGLDVQIYDYKKLYDNRGISFNYTVDSLINEYGGYKQ
jgi:saccharopine dehydrogenase-like NADP-dependent oxidoreductase